MMGFLAVQTGIALEFDHDNLASSYNCQSYPAMGSSVLLRKTDLPRSHTLWPSRLPLMMLMVVIKSIGSKLNCAAALKQL